MPKGSPFFIVLESVIVVGLLCAIWYVWNSVVEIGTGTNQEIRDSETVEARAIAARLAGTYSEAARLFETASKQAETYDYEGRLLIDAAISNFHIGTRDAQEKAVNQLATVVRSAQISPEYKSRAITIAANAVCDAGCDDHLFNTVFDHESFSAYKAEGDTWQSLVNLYEHALSISRQSTALVRLAGIHAEQVFLGVSDERYLELKTEIVLLLKEAEQLMPQEGLDEHDNIAFYTWMGYSYGALATVEPEEYEDLFASAYMTALGVGGPHPGGGYANEVLAIMYYQYAALLHQVYGVEASDEVEKNIASLIEIVSTDASPENNQLLTMIAQEQSGSEQGNSFMARSVDVLRENYQRFSSIIQ